MKMLIIFGMSANVAFYNLFCRGIYTFRNTELLNTRNVPFVAKVAFTTIMSFSMCYSLYKKNLYEIELYTLALKYRDNYDKDYLSSRLPVA